MIIKSKLLVHNGNSTHIVLNENNSLTILTQDGELKQYLKQYKRSYDSYFFGLYSINNQNIEELIDFVCGTKWPSYLQESMNILIEALTNGQL